MVHFYTSKCAGKISSLLSIVDPTSGQVTRKHPKTLKAKEYANLQIKLEDRMCLELFSNFKNMGRVIIRKGDFTIAAGTVQEMIS
jgi:elongation factor 1 alpha-like protein